MNTVMHYERLRGALWPGRIPNADNHLRMVIWKLRKSIRPTPFEIIVHYQIGYEMRIRTDALNTVVATQ
jgi:DNA-binding SARP family transcriptional activator